MNIEIEPLEESYVMRKDREPIGFISVAYFKNIPQCEIQGLYVDPAYRNKGYGKQLIKHIIDKVDKNIVEIAATCEEQNIASNHIFEELGFKRFNKWVLRKT